MLCTYTIYAVYIYNRCSVHIQYMQCTYTIYAVYIYNRCSVHIQYMQCTYTTDAVYMYIGCIGLMHIAEGQHRRLSAGNAKSVGPHGVVTFRFRDDWPIDLLLSCSLY